MIRPPRRSVTRFFIPLIDVLILLFCVFLLMPFVGTPDATADPDADPNTQTPADNLRAQVLQLQLDLAQAKAEIERLQAAAASPANRVRVRVLEIDAADGKLYAFDPDFPDDRQEVRDQADAQRLIDQARRTARGKDVFFLMLYPRVRSGFPEQPQVESYSRWFQGVPHGFDNPWGQPAPANVKETP
jgi:hypothetical protein